MAVAGSAPGAGRLQLGAPLALQVRQRLLNAGPSAAAIAIRGISFEDIEKSFDPAVGVVVDDVFIGTNTGQLLDAFDLESIEILRGPQGTLFGRNTIGGVSVQPSQPGDEPDGPSRPP